MLCFLAAASVSAAGERITGGDITRAFKGVTLDGIYFDGTYFTEVYHDDGTIRYWDADGADNGGWSVREGRFCTFYAGQQGACFFVVRDGDNCFTFYETEDFESDWTSRGWNRAMEPTCPTPPEVAL